MNQEDYPVRIFKLGEEGDDPYLAQTTAVERLQMMWPLTVQAWAFMGVDVSQSRLQRDVVRVIRRGEST